MGLLTPDEYDRLARVELDAAATISDPDDKRRRLNQASAFATLAELARDRAEPDAPVVPVASLA